jgi:hypothetical protein
MKRRKMSGNGSSEELQKRIICGKKEILALTDDVLDQMGTSKRMIEPQQSSFIASESRMKGIPGALTPSVSCYLDLIFSCENRLIMKKLWIHPLSAPFPGIESADPLPVEKGSGRS